MKTDRFNGHAPLLGFTVLAFAIAWGAELILRAVAQRSGLEPDRLRTAAEIMHFDELGGLTVSPWVAYLLTRCQDFAFSLAAVIVISVTTGLPGLRELASRLCLWRVGGRWYCFALLPFALYAIAVCIADGGSGRVLSSFTVSPRSLRAILFGAEYGLFVTLLFRGPLGEEPGLRGYALPQLRQHYSAFTASFCIGVVWALWHLPVLINRAPVVVIAFLLVALSLSFLFTWLFEHSAGSLLPVLLLHTAQNSEEVFETLFPKLRETDWELPSTALLLLCGVAAACALWRQRRRG